MARYVKCWYKECGKTHDYKVKDTLRKETIELKDGKKTYKYYCEECYEKQLKANEFIKAEMAEKDHLNEVVKKIYGISININLPKKWWEMIQDLRNGTNRYQKFFKKRYKKGVPYSVMAEAFRMSKDSIEWARLNRKFKTAEQELMYGLIIMQSKLVDADRKIKKTKIEEKRAKEIEKVQLEYMEDNREVVYKKKDSKNDYSHLLGDD